MRCCCGKGSRGCSSSKATMWSPRSAMASPLWRPSAPTGQVCLLCSDGCRRATPTGAVAPAVPPRAAVGEPFVGAVAPHRPDGSIVDVRMPPSHTYEGLRAAVSARQLVAGTPILVLSQYVELSYADDLLATGGAVGHLLNDRHHESAHFTQ